METPLDSICVANTFIDRFSDHGCITHMKLQKLCYYSYGWWLALMPNEPALMKSKPQVWKLGPVFHPIYSAFSAHRSQIITEKKQSNPFSDAKFIAPSECDESKLIDWIWNRYGQFDGVQLSDMTHEPGTPWRRKVEAMNFRVPRFLELEDDEIRPYFTNLATDEGIHNRVA